MRKERQQLDGELQTLRRQLKEKEVALKGLHSDLQRMTTRANRAEAQALNLESKVSKVTPLAAAAPVPRQRPVPKVTLCTWSPLRMLMLARF